MAEHWKRTSWRYLEFFLCAVFPFTDCFENPNRPWYPQTLSFISSTHEVHRAPAASPVLAVQPRNSIKAVSRGQSKVHLVCLPSLKDHYLLFPCVQCVENHGFKNATVLSWFGFGFGCFRQEHKFSPFLSILARGIGPQFNF